MIDLRSDTVTRPSPSMREAMASAEVGDDVFGEDPSIRALEEETASLLGKEAALFVTSGTMSNQLAIALHTRPADEVIVSWGAHVMNNESGAGAALSGVQFSVVGEGGFFDANDVEGAIQPSVYYVPRTSLVCVENTHNRAGGRVFPQRLAIEVAACAKKHGLGVHLDGARIWNAAAASGLSPKELAAPFDTLSVCFSKGLGAPVGSALVASREHVERARRLRKMWGGGMRQGGILAAGALYALRHNRARISEDHASAKAFAERIAKAAKVDLANVETNIVNVDLDVTAEPVVAKAKALGLLVAASGNKRIRVVTHLDAPLADVERAADILAQAIGAA